MSDLDEQLDGVAALGEPARRTLYEYVARQPAAVSREQAAEAVAMPAHSVKFHLEKLVSAGLLEVEFRRLTGRTGPGAGRPAKLYRRSERQLAVMLPPRSYDLAGDLLASAIERAGRDDLPVTEAVHEVAREEGRRISRTADTDEAARPPAGRAGEDLGRVTTVLAGQGYEPRLSGGTVRLANCPFDRLAAEHTELVCGMNLSLVGGLLDGLEVDSVTARLRPSPGLCCVEIGP